MSHMKGIHVSFDIVDEFIPRVPRQRCPGEDETVPRICVAEDILNAVNAVPQAGLVMENMKSLGLPVVIHAYYLTGEGMGKDAPSAANLRYRSARSSYSINSAISAAAVNAAM